MGAVVGMLVGMLGFEKPFGLLLVLAVAGSRSVEYNYFLLKTPENLQ